MWKVTRKHVRVTVVALETQQVSNTRIMSVCLIQHPERMRRIILSPVACLVLPYFFTLYHKRHDFLKQVFAHKIMLLFCTMFEIFIILRKIQWDIIINVRTSSCKVHVILATL